jgi:hypothetical protein
MSPEGGVESNARGERDRVMTVPAATPQPSPHSALRALVARHPVAAFLIMVFAVNIAPALLVNGMFLDAEFGPAFLLFLLWTAIASVVLILRAGEPRLVEKRGTHVGGAAPVR